MQRKIEDKREARACLKAAAGSGLSLGAWAREHGIDGRSLNAWRVNLSRSAPRSRGRLVELVAAPSDGGACRYVVRVGDVAIELGDDFREESLTRLVRALRAC